MNLTANNRTRGGESEERTAITIPLTVYVYLALLVRVVSQLQTLVINSSIAIVLILPIFFMVSLITKLPCCRMQTVTDVPVRYCCCLRLNIPDKQS